MEPEAVARHQRGRLEGAMVDAVVRHGYAATTLRELVALARVSKSTFYEHFDSKQDCFFATYQVIVDEIVRRIDLAIAEHAEIREKLVAGLGVLMKTVVEERPAAYLVIVESLTLGEAAVAQRDRASDRFEDFITTAFGDVETPRPLSDLTVRGVVAGIRNIIYHRLRNDRAEELPALVDTVADWIMHYAEIPGAPVERAAAAAARSGPFPPIDDGDTPGWSDLPDSPESRAKLSQRERIIRAAARVGIEKGYASLSIPAISAAAGVSNQTFYDHFPGKREAFVAAFDALSGEALRSVVPAFESETQRPDAVGAGVKALLEHIAADELFASLAFFELPAAGPLALDLADRVLSGFTTFFTPQEAERDVPQPIVESIAGGVWAIVQHEIVAGRSAQLPELAAEVTVFAITPFRLSAADTPG